MSMLQQKSKPECRPFAVMRLTHEAIRAGIQDVLKAMDDPDAKEMDLANVKQLFADLNRCITIHALQEDEVFFPLLNEKFNNVLWDGQIPSEHVNDSEMREKIVNEKSEQGLRTMMTQWAGHHEEHLKMEEEAMMPLTKKTADTVQGRGAIVRDIINIDRDEFSSFQFQYVLRQLVKNKPLGAVAMYLKAVQMASNVVEYEAVRGKIQGIVGAETFAKLQKTGIMDDGKQTD